MLLQPGVGEARQALGAAIRYRTTALSTRDREIAVLTVARVLDSAYERFAHEAVARVAGLTDGEIDALRNGEPAGLDDARGRLVLATTAALASQNDLNDDGYTARPGTGSARAGCSN